MDQQFPFMRLPLELRFIVYKELLVKPNPINCSQHGYTYIPRWDGDRHWSDHDPPNEPLNLCLLRASRTIHAECGMLFYTTNTFQADSLPALLHWLQNELSTRHRRAITRLIVYWDDIRPGLTMQALNTCIGLRYLDLRFLELTPLGRERHWLHFEGLIDLLKLRGIEGLMVSNDEGDPVLLGDYQGWDMLLVALRVVRRPRSRGEVMRQYKRDFPGIRAEGGVGSVGGWPRVVGTDSPRHPVGVYEREHR